MQFSFSVFSATDIGLKPTGFGSGTYKIGAPPRAVVVEDDDGVLNDEAGIVQNASSPFQNANETVDKSSQTMVGDLDGMGADGHIIQSVYKFAVFNATTGQSGTAYMLRVYKGTDPSSFQSNHGGGQMGPYYYAMTVPFSAGDQITFTQPNWVGQVPYSELTGGLAVCFTARTMIDTPTGPRAVEMLRPGDTVTTRTGTAQMRWLGVQKISLSRQETDPRLTPVRIAAGALGHGRPNRDLLVSGQHRMLVHSASAHRKTGACSVLVAAQSLIGLPGIDRPAARATVTYVHFLCDRHEIVFANGAACETMLPGVQALKNLLPDARSDMLAVLTCPASEVAPAAPILGRRQVRKLIDKQMLWLNAPQRPGVLPQARP